MWISGCCSRYLNGAINMSTVVSKSLIPSAPELWIIRQTCMICVVLSSFISIAYASINTCGKRAGFITRCKILSISSSATLFAPGFRAGACGRIVD